MTAPPYECPTRIEGLETRSSVRITASMSLWAESRLYWAAITSYPSATSGGISLLKHEPSAQIPWQKTMLGLRDADMRVPFCRTVDGCGAADNPAAWRPSRQLRDRLERGDDMAMADPMTYVERANDVTASAQSF